MLRVGEIGPVFGWDFELRLFFGSLSRCGAFDGTEWNFVGGFVAVNADWESYFEQDVLFVPLGLHLYVNARNACIESDVLCEGGILKVVSNADH